MFQDFYYFVFTAPWSSKDKLLSVNQSKDTSLGTCAVWSTRKIHKSCLILTKGCKLWILQLYILSVKFNANVSPCSDRTIHHGHKGAVRLYRPPCSLGLLWTMWAVIRTIQAASGQRTNRVLGLSYRAQVDPFSVLGRRGYGNSLGHESPLCSRSRGSVQSVDHLSLPLSLSTLTFSLTASLSAGAAALDLMPGFTFQHRLFLGNIQ